MKFFSDEIKNQIKEGKDEIGQSNIKDLLN
jgi:hypothetical protein